MPIPISRAFRHLAALAIVAALVSVATARVAAAQPPPPEGRETAAQPGPQADATAGEREGAAQAAEHAGAAEAAHGESLWPVVFRLINFAVLVGTLVYFLKKPFATYLQNRGMQIRRDLVEAEALRAYAQAQIAALEEKLKALPGEIDALRTRGAEEIAAEEARIRAAAEAERERLLEQTRREIELQVRVAKQELRREAAELAVGVAGERIRKNLTPDTHLRLVDRYADQVKEVRTFHD